MVVPRCPAYRIANKGNGSEEICVRGDARRGDLRLRSCRRLRRRGPARGRFTVPEWNSPNTTRRERTNRATIAEAPPERHPSRRCAAARGRPSKSRRHHAARRHRSAGMCFHEAAAGITRLRREFSLQGETACADFGVLAVAPAWGWGAMAASAPLTGGGLSLASLPFFAAVLDLAAVAFG